MLTLEQVSAVNDGLRKADLKSALKPLEDTIDLRANELPRLDAKARKALKEGLKNEANAAIWADAILHRNVSVRRFARKIFMGLGDDAAPVFEPLRAGIERFWRQEEPLPWSMSAREAALRREQNEKIESALELLLRADPERFVEFYASLADDAPPAEWEEDEADWQTPEFVAWQERNAAAWEATSAEVERLLEAEWGSEWLPGEKRAKLPERVENELDARARQTPAIAALWEGVGENPLGAAWQQPEPKWEPVAELRAMWSRYLTAYDATGPMRRVAERVWPVVWGWLQAAFDASLDITTRERMVRRCSTEYGVHVERERMEAALPALLLVAKDALWPAIEARIESGTERFQRRALTGDALVADLWLQLFQTLGGQLQMRQNYPQEQGKQGDAAEPEFDVTTLRALLEGFPDDLPATNYHQWTLSQFRESLNSIEKGQDAPSSSSESVEPIERDLPTYRYTMNVGDALSIAQIQQYNGALGEEFLLYGERSEADNAALRREIENQEREMLEQVAIVEDEIIALDDEARLERLVRAPHPRVAGRTISRSAYWGLWTRDLNVEEIGALKARLWACAQEPLWAQLEAQLEAYRRTDVEAIEPDVEAKLTAREAKEWRAQTRRDKRELLESDILDIEEFLVANAGLAARLRALEMADRPSCRGIRDQLEDKLAAELDLYPGGYRYALFPIAAGFGSFGGGYSTEVFESEAALESAWQNWKLGAEWDEVLERMEARLGRLKTDDWQRVNLQRQLATGHYRRGDFAQFEHYAAQPGAFPQAVALAVGALDDFAAWRVLIGRVERWQDAPLQQFWEAQQADETRRARAVEAVTQTLSTTSDEQVARTLLGWMKPLEAQAFEPHISEVENALESALVPVKKWALLVLGQSDDFDRERAVPMASEMLWSENAGLAKDAAKFLAVLATQDADVAELVWDALNDATSLENLGVCEAVFRALVKVKSKHKTLNLSEAAREKLELLSQAQSERFGKFGAKLK